MIFKTTGTVKVCKFKHRKGILRQLSRPYFSVRGYCMTKSGETLAFINHDWLKLI